MRKVVVVLFAVAIVLGEQVQSQTCGKDEACPEGACCMLNPGARYALPVCSSLRPKGDACRPNAEPQDYWLYSSPNDPGSLYTNVYWAVCPCQSGLQCDAGTCV